MTIRPAAPPAAFDAARPETARPAAGAPDRAAPPGAIPAAERQALDREFPAAPDLALRLYGPRGGGAPAAALGGRLDLRG